MRAMMDTYHFWGGISKFEDLEAASRRRVASPALRGRADPIRRASFRGNPIGCFREMASHRCAGSSEVLEA